MLAAQILKGILLKNDNLLENSTYGNYSCVEQKMHHLVSSFLVKLEHRQFLSTSVTQAQ